MRDTLFALKYSDFRSNTKYNILSAGVVLQNFMFIQNARIICKKTVL